MPERMGKKKKEEEEEKKKEKLGKGISFFCRSYSFM
jgi:hypothetical protein